MRHRVLSFICAMVVACAICTGALAAGGGVSIVGGASSIFTNSGEGSGFFYVNTMAATGDTLYALSDTSDGLRLAVWQAGMEAPILLGAGKEEGTSTLINANWYSSVEDLEGMEGDTVHAIGMLFSDGERLLGINPLTGLVFEIEVDGEEIIYKDMLTLKDLKPFFHQVDGENAYGVGMSSCALVDGVLYFTTNDWSDDGWQINKLYSADLTSGEVSTKTVENVLSVCSYKDGKLLAIIHDQENAWNQETQEYKNPDLAVYDPATDSVEIKTEFPISSVSSVGYCASLDAAIYMDTSRIMGLKDLTEVRQYGYAPVSYVNQMIVWEEAVIISNYDETMIRALSEDFKSDEYLMVSGSWMDDGEKLFTSRYPNIPVYFSNDYYSDVESLSQAMVSGEDSVDLIELSIVYSSFNTLMEKGYCADLSGYTELVEAVNRMQPVLRDAVMKDGKLYAIPTSVYSWGWFYNTEVMEEIGFTEEDIPTNFVDLCELVTRWNDELLDEYPNYSLFDYVSNTKQSLFYWMMDAYLDWCTAQGKDVTFETPEFRAMMTALEDVRCEDLDRVFSDEMDSDVYRQGLLVYGYQTVGDFSWMDGSSEWQRFIPMTLTKDTEYAFDLEVQVMFINPRSAHMDSAVQLLLCKLEALSNEQERVMFTDVTEPVLNPYYDEWMEDAQKWLASMKESLEEADEADKKEIQANIEAQEQYIERFQSRRYSISQEQIDYYQQEIAPHMFVAQPTFLNGTKENSSAELSTLMDRFREGQIGLDQFIREADNKMRMMRLENE